MWAIILGMLLLVGLVVLLVYSVVIGDYYGRFTAKDWAEFHRPCHQKARHLLKRLTKALKREGATYWLAEGTLLGAKRHKGFIPWDNDIDLAVLVPQRVWDESSCEEDGWETYLAWLTRKLEKHGLRVRRPLMTSNFGLQIYDDCWSDFIDIMVYRHHRHPKKCSSNLDLVCKTPMGRPFRHAETFPLKSCAFEGLRMPVPRDSVSFIRRTYGKGAMKEGMFSVVHPSSLGMPLLDIGLLWVNGFWPRPIEL